MAGRVSGVLKEQLVETGRWNSFLLRRDDFKAQGYSPSAARVSALREVMAERGDDGDSATPAAKDSLPCAPEGLAGKKANEAEIVRWVARSIDDPDPRPEDCPDPFAWTLLRHCRDDPSFSVFFIEKLWGKLIPTRSQLETKGPDLDGKPTIELIGRILAMRNNAMGDAVASAPPQLADSKCSNSNL